MNWLVDIAARCRMRDALAAGKRVIRKVNGCWFVFYNPGEGPVECGSHAQAVLVANLT